MSYTDWIGGLEIIPNRDKKTILELGVGEGTQYLLSEFKHVYSFEVYKTKEWYDKCVKEFLYSDTFWTHKFIHFDEIGMGGADDLLLRTNGFTRQLDILDKYIVELEKFVDLSKIDVAFVDQGFHMRGETVNYFLEKGVPIVMCHDYKTAAHLYGWNLIKENPNYDIKLYDSTQGLNLWIKK